MNNFKAVKRRKKMKKRLLSAFVASCLIACSLTGCGSKGSTEKASTAASTAKSGSAANQFADEVNLTMYVVSDRPAGQDLIDENFNKLLKEKMNTTLTINWIPWSDFANKYPLLFSSGEEFDMAYTSNWLNWTQLARKGAFMNLDDLWEKYAPDNFKATTENAKKQAKVDGHYYVIPTQLATYKGYGPIYRTKFDDGKEYKEEVKDFASYEKYLDWVKANEPGMQPFEVYSEGTAADDNWMYINGFCNSKGATNDFLFFDPKEANPKLFTYYEYPQVKDYLSMMKRWNEKGFFSKSALSDTDATKTQNGVAATRLHNIDTYGGYYSMHPDWNFKFADFVKYEAHLPYTQDALAISHTSKNPERALAFWNLVTTDREVYDAFYFGVLGTSYELDDKGHFTLLDTNNYNTSAMWAVRTNEFHRMDAKYPDSYETLRKEWEEKIKADDTAEKFSSFIIDTSKIETEYAACNSVHQQYWWPLELGYTDIDKGLAEYEAKMKAAGVDKVRAEIQRQLDEYVAGLGK